MNAGTDAEVNTRASPLPEVVSADEWAARRAELLGLEKQATGARDALAATRRRLPMVEWSDAYRFTGDGPAATLIDLFERRRQLVVDHFMHRLDGGWCEGCSMFSETIGRLEHLHARDTTLAFVSATPWERLGPYRERMGWPIPFSPAPVPRSTPTAARPRASGSACSSATAATSSAATSPQGGQPRR